MILDLNEDHSENVPYSHPEYFLFIEEDSLSQYPGYMGLSHWHSEVEFIAILSGEMDYNVNGKIVRLQKGDGLFVNSRQLHYGFSKARRECRFLCILLHPKLLCSTLSMEQEYVAPVLSNPALFCWPLHASVDWERRILQALFQMHDCMNQPAFPLRILGLFCEIWQELYAHAPCKQPFLGKSSRQLDAVRDMLAYIQRHYAEKITLDEISAAGSVCKSKCCSLFSEYLGQTPIRYLISYRLEKSVELMASTELSISEIGYETGFLGPSYFSETFRKRYGCSPGKYREKFYGKDCSKRQNGLSCMNKKSCHP